MSGHLGKSYNFFEQLFNYRVSETGMPKSVSRRSWQLGQPHGRRATYIMDG